MAAITVVEVNEDISLATANGGGDTVVSGTRNGGHQLDGVFVVVNNGGGAPITCTVNGTAYTVGDGEMHALPANTGINPGTALTVAYSGVTSVTVGAFRT